MKVVKATCPLVPFTSKLLFRLEDMSIREAFAYAQIASLCSLLDAFSRALKDVHIFVLCHPQK